jgi:hypothetical protein
MKFSFHSEFEEELLYATNYYEEVLPGLGFDFRFEGYSVVLGGFVT